MKVTIDKDTDKYGKSVCVSLAHNYVDISVIEGNYYLEIGGYGVEYVDKLTNNDIEKIINALRQLLEDSYA